MRCVVTHVLKAATVPEQAPPPGTEGRHQTP